MGGRAAFGVLVVVATLLTSGSASTAGGETAAAEPPLYGLLSGPPQERKPWFLTRLDPRTLAPIGTRRIAVARRMSPAGRSPDGRFAAFYERQPARLRVIDLATMRVRGDVPLRLGKRWRIREGAWLTADRVVFVVQRLRGSYQQIVDTRQIVVVDPLALRVVARRAFANAMAVTAARQGGDKLVLLLGRGDLRSGRLLLVVVGSSGQLRSTWIALDSAERTLPSLVVEPSGGRAYVIVAGSPILDVDLTTLQVIRRPVSGAGDLLAPREFASRGALRIDERTLAVFGSDHTVGADVETSRPAGLALIDTTTWEARVIDRQATGATFSAGTLLAYGWRLDRARAGGKPRQRAVGIGLRAYDSSGALRWQRFPGQALFAAAVRDIAIVHRHPLTGPGRFFPIDLATGRQTGPERSAERNFVWLLPEPSSPSRMLAASDEQAEPIEIAGRGEAFNGTARDDVSRVVAVLVDGSEQDIPLQDGEFGYRADSPEKSARTVRAYSGDQLVATVTLDVRCGGSSGPCAALTPAGSDPFARVSNRGTRVQARAERPGEREMTPRDLFLLRRDEGRAVYRIGGLRPGFNACYAGGPAAAIGRRGHVSCTRSAFPSRRQPLYDMSAVTMNRGEKTPHLLRLEGIAADAIAEIGLTDTKGDVIARVPVVDNVYLLASPPAEATGGLVAYDRGGAIVFRTDRRRQPGPRPPTTPGRLADFRIKLTLPKGWTGEIKRSSAGPARALVLAGNRVPARDLRSVSLALTERDPRSRPAFPRLARPPRLTASDVRPAGPRFGRAERRFTLNGRQFTLQVGFGTRRPARGVLAEVNRLLATLEVGAIAVPRAAAPTGTPLQSGHADGVAVDVYRSGIVVFRFDPASRLYRLLGGKRLSVACLTFDSVSPWETNEWWASKPLAPTVQFIVSEAARPQLPYATLDPATEAKPPFDGCLVSGSYGRRWSDPRGQHSPGEIAFTARGRRFFDERAVARDLALFVRTPGMRAVSRQMRGGRAPSAEAIAERFPSRVVAVKSHDAFVPRGTIGVWRGGGGVIEVSERTRAGGRLFVRLRAGRIVRHNLEGLAFVF